MFDKVKIHSHDFVFGLVVGSCIIGMTLSFIFTLAEVASKPAAHPASYAVTSSPYPFYTHDQGCATHVSLSGPVPGLFVEEIR